MSGWQPIETAPRDGTHILAACADRPFDKWWTFNQRPPDVVHWFEDAFYSSYGAEAQTLMPWTHWMPLPEPPQ